MLEIYNSDPSSKWVELAQGLCGPPETRHRAEVVRMVAEHNLEFIRGIRPQGTVGGPNTAGH
jgi:hypothetical protein